MRTRDEGCLNLPDADRIAVPWFFRRTHSSDMHHVEIITRLHGEKAEQLEALVAAATAVDGHEPLGEHKFLRLTQGDDLSFGFIAYEGETTVGYAHTLTFGAGDDRRVSCEIVVHPDFRRAGIGRALLMYVIRHAESEGGVRLDLWAYNDSPASRSMMAGSGLTSSRKLLHMHRHPGPPPALAAPEGASIRAFRPGEDDEAWVALNNRIFAGHPENGTWTLDDLRARLSQPWFSADDLLVLESDGAMVGFCWVKVEERGDEGRVGEIYIIGVSPEEHGKGLGRYLLAEGLRHLSQRGVDAVAVYVDQANERGVALYWAFEFHHHHVDVLYSLPLPAASLETAESTASN